MELHKRWKHDPSKGEVFTPEELVKEMLDKIPNSVWENPKSTFLDPCMGKGTFLIDILRRLTTIYGHSVEDVMSRIYGYDLRVKYVNYLKRGNFVNIFHKNFLTEKADMKFDVVIGNPPYQDTDKPGDNALYQHFTKKVLDDVLVDGGYFSFVLPTTMCDYLLLCEKNRTYIRDFYNIKSMVFDFPEDYFRKIGIGTTAFYFTLKKEVVNDTKQSIEITFKQNGKRVTLNKLVSKGEVLPKRNFAQYEKLVSMFLSENSFEFKVMKTQDGKNRRIRSKQIQDGTVTELPTVQNIYPIIDKITKNNGPQTYYFSEMMVDYYSNKVVFSKSGYPMATYINTPVNLSDNMMYLPVDSEIEGRNIAFIINSKLFSEVIKLFSTNARDAHKTICKLKKINLSTTLLNNEQDIIDKFHI